MRNFIISLCCSICIMGDSYAESSDSWQDTIRFYVEKILGESLTNRILGNKLDEMEIPEIPRLVKDATSTAKFPKEPKKTQVPADKKQSFDYSFILELYHVTRGTKPNEHDVSRWLNALSQGGTRSGIFRALVLDDVYAGLENYEGRITQDLADFSIDFAKEFFNQTITIEQLKKLNFYSMKRILGERALSVVEQFIMDNREDDLYRWYGIIQARFARDYPELWTGNIVRENKMIKYHYEWAKSVPWEYLKSELVIKLFLVLIYING